LFFSIKPSVTDAACLASANVLMHHHPSGILGLGM
jgi:hypothetical protein